MQREWPTSLFREVAIVKTLRIETSLGNTFWPTK